MKTFSDQDRNAVRLTPETTTIHAIARRRAPSVTPVWRATSFQRQTWEVVAQIVNYRSEEGELRLRLFDDGVYMNAAVPTPSCLPATSRARDQIARTWREFARSCAIPRYRWQPLGAVAYIRGVGFWSQRHTEHGTAANGAELHPVTSFRIIAGCA